VAIGPRSGAGHGYATALKPGYNSVDIRGRPGFDVVGSPAGGAFSTGLKPAAVPATTSPTIGMISTTVYLAAEKFIQNFPSKSISQAVYPRS
jgi:hypothetical protein